MGVLKGPILLIANPAARQGARREALAVAAFARAGVACEAIRTTRPGHAAEIAAARGHDYSAVFALGGDGTAVEVLDALANTGLPVGILPGGTGNLVAHSLGVPRSIDRAVPALLAGRAAKRDLGVLDGHRHFAFTAGVGLDARMIAETTPLAKQRFGRMAYAYTATRAAFLRRPLNVRVEVDGGDEVIEREALAVMVANFGTVVEDVFVLGPGIRADDGLLDLCLFAPRLTSETVRVAWNLVRREYTANEAILYRRARTFAISCDPPEPVQADGEMMGMTPVVARVAPAAATLLLPARD